MPVDEARETLPDDWGAGWEAHRVHQLTFALSALPPELARRIARENAMRFYRLQD